MAGFNFEKIDVSRKLLNLSNEATLSEIKKAYRDKVKKYHPDRCHNKAKRDENEKKMSQINQAYKVLLNYIQEYSISFKEEDVKRNAPDRDMRRFYQDWLEG